MQDASSEQQTKQKYKPNPQQTGVPPHSALPIRGKTKKNSAQISTSKTLTQTIEPTLGGQKETKTKRNQKEERIQSSSRKEFNFH